VEFAVLGPVEVRVEDRQLALGGPKQRAVLAILLLHPNQPVSRDRLVDALWGESPPPSAGHTLEDYVSRLRRTLGEGRIERRAPGYAVRVEPGELDLERFEALLERGRAAAIADDPTTASNLLGEALGLWRGRALADLEYEPFAGREAERLEERRLLALEGRIDAELELGHGAELVGELERLVAENPFRERLLGQLMLCLYRAGRQADALGAYRTGRSLLAGELGLEPSLELRELERRILEHDPKLGASAKTLPVARRQRRSRGWLVVAGLALAASAASVVVGIKLGTDNRSASGAPASTAGVFELSAHRGAVIRAAAPGDAAAMAADARSVWLAEPNAGEVVRVDLASHRLVERIPLGGSPSALALGGGAVWVASVPGDTLTRIDPATEGVTQHISLGGARVAALAFGRGHLWVADPTDEALLELDPATGALERTLQVNVHPNALAIGSRAIWISDYDAGLLAEVDPRSGASIATIRVGNGPAAVAVGDRAVWVANSLDSTVSEIDPTSDRVAATIPVGSEPVGLAVSGLWVSVANEYSSTVSRIDSRRDVVAQTTVLGGGPTALVAAAGRIWVATRTLGAHRGGTLVLLHTRPLSLDPALQVDSPPFQSNGLTNDALLTHTRTGGPQALLLVPDLAVGVPIPTDDGTTYTFRLRPGRRYSNGRLVRADDFRRALERLFRLDSPVSGSYTRIAGAATCTRAHCDLARGIVTDDATGTITFHLRAPDPDFLSSLTSIATAPVPPGVPWHDTGRVPVPGTGPYMVASANKHEIRYVRNPRFHEWSHAAQPDGNPDEIDMRYGLTPAQEIRAVERGRADWSADGVPASLLEQVTTRFAAETHYLLTTETDFLQLNTNLPPFNDRRVREALNLAIDRAAIVRIFGGPRSATPTCQILPPGVLGYRRYCPYTRAPAADGRWSAPNITHARRLVAASGTRGEQVSVWGASDGPVHENAVVPYVVNVLRRLGYRAQARLLPSSYFAHAPPSLFQTMQVALPGWAAPTPFDFFGIWALCSAEQNHHWICDPRLDHAIRDADTLEATDTRAASTLWTKIDHELVDRAVWVPLVNPHWIDFVSRRVHNYQADPNLGLIADQASLR
jgi:YVTN family beta-propeller protein